MSDDNENKSLTLHLSLTSSPSSPKISHTIPSDQPTSGSKLKSEIATKTNIPLSSLRIIFRGRLLADSTTDVIKEYKLEDECVIHCMGKPQQQPSSATPAPAAAAASTVAGSSVTVPPTTTTTPPTTTTTPTTPTTDPLQTLHTSLQTLHSSNTPSAHQTALSTLSKILTNITQNPTEEKYRKVKQSNAAFQRRLGGVSGGRECMLAVGFVEEEGSFVLKANAEAWERVVACQREVERVLREGNVAGAGGGGGSGGAAGVGGGPFGGGGASFPFGSGMPSTPMGFPGMEDAMTNMLGNPEALRGMLQNPMVRQMMQNDPRLANNPMMQQQLDLLANDPQLLQRMSTMMSDPTVRSQVQQMMSAQGATGTMPPNPFLGVGGGFGSGAGGTNSGSGSAAASAAAGGGTDPAAMAQQMQILQRMMQATQGAGTGVTPPSGGSNAAAQGGQQQQQQTQQGGGGGGGGGNDDEQTEEEMIAEAIARSLRES